MWALLRRWEDLKGPGICSEYGVRAIFDPDYQDLEASSDILLLKEVLIVFHSLQSNCKRDYFFLFLFLYFSSCWSHLQKK